MIGKKIELQIFEIFSEKVEDFRISKQELTTDKLPVKSIGIVQREGLFNTVLEAKKDFLFVGRWGERYATR